MKKFYMTLLTVALAAASIAQVPDKMSYQAVIRDTEGNLVTEQEIGMKISILQGTADGTEVYTETQTPVTNKNGLVSIEIGGMAGFADIDWSDGPYFLKTETDPEGGTDYTISGTSQLLTVPYALHAKTAETISEPIVESDPVFEASPAAGIETADIINWDEAHSWGDHADAGYLAEESDPLFTAWDRSTGIEITESQITDLQTYYLASNPDGFITTYIVTEEDVTAHESALSISESQITDLQSYLTSITGQSVGDLSDVDLTGIEAGKVLKYDAVEEKWVVADHLGLIEETDPVFEASPAAGIETADIINWDEAHNWGDHAGEGYLTEETDPLFAAWDKSEGIIITESQVTDLQEYYLASNPDGFITAYIVTEQDVTAHESALSISESQISDLQSYLTSITGQSIGNLADVDLTGIETGKVLKYDAVEEKWVVADLPGLTEETDPVFEASPAADIETEDIANWDEAYSWGDHAEEGYLTEETDPVFEASPAAGIETADITNWDEAHSWGDHAEEEYLTEETDPVFEASPAAGIETEDIANWDEAHNWGDHAEADYLVEEDDPIFASSVASEITQEDVENWDAKSDFDGEFSSLTGVPASAITPPGVINMFAGGNAPYGYLICDGREVCRTEYADLFAVINTLYGEGDGATTFNLPNLQTRVPVGLHVEDPNFDELGKTGGAQEHVLSIDEMPSHNHSGTTSSSGGHTHTGNTTTSGQHTHTGFTTRDGAHRHQSDQRQNSSQTGGTAMSGASYSGGTAKRLTTENGGHQHGFTTHYAGNHNHQVVLNDVGNHNHVIMSEGGGMPHNNMQPYIVLNFIIKY